MIRKAIGTFLAVAGIAAGGCASSPEPERELIVAVGPNGEMMFLPGEGADDEEAAMVAALNQVMAQMAAEEAAAEALSDDEIWQELDGGHLLHIQSGAICATEMAGIGFNEPFIFADDGSDVGCHYTDAARQQSYVTFYVYLRPHDAATEWEDAQLALRTRQPVAQDVPFSSPDAGYSTLTLAYEGADGTRMRSSTVLGQANGWFMKLRITCPIEECGRVEQLAAIGLIGQMDRVRMGDRAPDIGRAAPT